MEIKEKMNNMKENAAQVVRNVLMAYPEVAKTQIDDIVDVILGTKVIVEPQVANFPPMEPPVKPHDAAKLLGVTTKALEYHARRGRLRQVRLDGATRSFGYVASDIRTLLEGRFNPVAA